MVAPDKRKYGFQQEKFGHNNYEAKEEEFFVVGDRIYVDDFRPASVAYFGETDFAPGDWLGVVLDDPTGDHDGKLHGRAYFQCAPNHGLFVRPFRVNKMPEARQLGSSSSRASSRNSGRCSSSIMDSYFYDEDYRVPRTDSLASKLLHSGGGKKLSSAQGTRGAVPNQFVMQTPIGNHNNNHPSFDRILSTDTAPRGILKHNQCQASNNNKYEELAQRLSKVPSSANTNLSPPAGTTVFEFRPAREPLALDRSSPLARMRPNERVEFRLKGRDMQGTLRYLGETNFSCNQWAGVELDLPEGDCDGSLVGQRYFVCRDNYGVFVPAKRLTRCQQQESKTFDSNSLRSTVISPPPTWRASSAQSFVSSESPCSRSSSSMASGSPFSPVASSSKASPVERQSNHFYHKPSRYNMSQSNKELKFDEADIERELLKSLGKYQLHQQPMKTRGLNIEPVKPKAVKYRFTSTKHGGNPIAWRSVEFG